jgi:pimeloyl-ACP methyl ester carboxylesterase
MDRVPGFSAAFLRMAFRDVYEYLTDRHLRASVMGRVLEPIAQQGAERVIVVAHSLGSIVAYDVLNTHPELRADLFVTLGSPLGIERGVRRKLLADERGKLGVPRGVRRWVNVADERDIVALDPTLTDDFRSSRASAITDLRVSNPARSPHSVTAYLRQPVVCREIANVLKT